MFIKMGDKKGSLFNIDMLHTYIAIDVGWDATNKFYIGFLNQVHNYVAFTYSVMQDRDDKFKELEEIINNK